jgi:hypothetical protein
LRCFVAFALTLSLVALAGRPAFADNDEEGKRHFRAGVTLYQGGNFSGALAEFRASQQLRPSANTLQNIALCQKELFRYIEAIATLESLLRDYGDKLPAAEKKAVRDAIDEMRPRVASVIVAVTPPNATLSVDGRPVPGGAERRVQLDVGEHAFEAEAPGYKPYARRIGFASADRRIEVALTAEVGTLSVRADDPEAAISVDGVARGKGAWAGTVSAGVKHVVTVAKPGKKTATLEALVASGERQELRAELSADALPPPYASPTAPDRAQHQGLYGHLMASTYFVSGHPDNYAVPESDRVTLDGAYFGFRVGYRLTNLFGLEGSFEAGRHNVGPGCYNQRVGGSTDCTDEQSVVDNKPTYNLAGRRIGVNGRLFFPTSPFTIITALGIGTVNHEFRIDASRDGTLTPVKANAWNGYAMLEGGAEFNVRRVLIDVVLVVVGEGVNNLGGEGPEREAYKGTPTIAMLGLGLRLGYGLF